MKYRQIGYRVLLALALVPGITLGGCAQHLSSMTTFAKADAPSATSAFALSASSGQAGGQRLI